MKILKKLFGKSDVKIDANEIAVAPDLLLGDAVIVDSGKNWVKFGDGTMICGGRITDTKSPILLGGGNAGAISDIMPVVFPQEFAVGPRVTLSNIRGDRWSDKTGETTKTGFNYQVFGFTAGSLGITEYIAIGIWKE